MLALHVLASGSSGNAAVVENVVTGAGVLIDCGICKRDFLSRCDQAGFDPARIEAAFVTHEHGDHVKGLGVVLRGLAKLGCQPPIYVARGCVANSDALAKVAEAFEVRELAAAAGASVIEAAGVRVIPFATSHDAAASFGFRIEDAADGDAISYLTDSGVVTPAAHAALADVRILALESNHDPKMLAAGPYPYVVKQRIASDAGHLSNGQAAAELAALVSASRAAGQREPQTVVAMHISQNNNEYSLAKRTLEAALAEANCAADVLCGYQARLTSVR
ncbi:MBL fold metallo-hydrolase [uncultured Senegalimassilia sp.]|uniref:MBL fold metallo-hydrolase n=1 Tax=uncultured Senegalimassilia sp. TaxID=1714350 RepID=UPI002674CF4D|nr:MBL fold metallo-hydrolase [uncultured Senegalimassilia sp.]